MQILGLLIGLAIGFALALPIVTALVSVPALASAAGLPAVLAGLPALGIPWFVSLALLALATVVFYVLVSFGVTSLNPGAPATTDWREELGRGLLIGQNAALNFAFIAIWLFPGAQLLAVFALVMNAAAVERSISNAPAYQVGLAYTGLFMPMTLPLNALGFLIGTVNTAAAALGAPFTVFVDWTRAAVVTHGGVVNGVPTAFNLANFIQAHPAMKRAVPWFAPATAFSPAFGPVFVTVNGALFHEGSHTLSAAAFGWIFHLVGFAAQWIPAPNANAYSELVAESGLRIATRNWVECWAPAIGAPANAPPTAAATVTLGPGIVDLGGATAVAVVRGTPVPMSAAASTDPDAYPNGLGFLWRAIDPAGATLALGTAATAALTPATGGIFSVDLLVTDGADGAGTGFGISLNVVGAAIAPVAGTTVNTPTAIDATASSVGSAAVVTATFSWSIAPASVPAGANASVVPGAPGLATFTADTPGSYSVVLALVGTMTDATGASVALSDPVSVIVVVA